MRVEYILPEFDSIVTVILQFMHDEDDDIALEACEFWNIILDYPGAKDILRNHLQQYVYLTKTFLLFFNFFLQVGSYFA